MNRGLETLAPSKAFYVLDLDDFEDIGDLDMDDLQLGPESGDYISRDGVNWYLNGELVITLEAEDDHRAELRNHMNTNAHWPNAWFVPSYGQPTMIDVWED